ncbi:MAG: response regulator, partial [Treponema sp.]|nr:response regulator [Treponema sp.]
MFSVLIVDDEEPVLDSYEYMLNSFSDGEGNPSPFTLTGKARTGYEALRLIHENEPDLVFMDINIPGIDGLAVLEDVYKKYPRMVCILSTAYERFDLAKRAIPLGAFAYLVKPVSKKLFVSTLENVLVKLRSLPPENSEFGDPRLSLLRRDIWTAMDDQRWSWYRENLALPSDYGVMLLVEVEQGMETWGERIKEMISYKYHCTFDVMLNRGLYLVSEDIHPDVLRKNIVKLLQDQLDSVVWYFGLGGCYRGPELYHSCNEALAELTANRQRTDVWSSVSNKIAVLRQKIGFAAPEETNRLFSAIWEPLFSEDFNAAKLRMVSLFTLLLDDIYGCWSVSSGGNSGGFSSGTAVNQPSPIMPPPNAPLPNMPLAKAPFDPAEIMELPDLGA